MFALPPWIFQARAVPSNSTQVVLPVSGCTSRTLPLESIEEGVGELLRLREEVRVQAPASLRRAMAKALSRLTAFYGPEV
jgi:predicted DNA-binding transcriptional regulator YafY